MELWNRPLTRMLCAEALEGRWLLSAAAPSNASGAPFDSGDVQIVGEIEPDDGDEDDAQIDVSQLPAGVLAALHERFPGAQVLEAELEEEDGETEYGVTASVNGQVLDVAFAPSGTILEVEEEVASTDLPLALREYLEALFPGAVVDEAAIVRAPDQSMYELTWAQPGQQALEATFFVPPSAVDGAAVSAGAPELPSAAFSAAVIADPQIDAQPPEESSPRDTQVAQATGATEQSEDAAPSQQRNAETALLPAWLIEAGQVRVAEALVSLAAGAGAAAWLPELADVMSEVLPIDVTSLERGIQDVLSEIDKLAQDALTNTTPSGAALRLSIVVSLVAGVQLLLLDRKLRKGGPIRVFSAANSSWSWVVGTVVPVRVRRVNYFRR